MKRVGNLFDTFAGFPNLLSAWKKARAGAAGKRETQLFTFHLEPELFQLQTELLEGVYRPRPYRYFNIHDPKERTISVAAFRDRVVHHALINVLEPLYERRFIFDSYATRKNKGTHKAVARAQFFLKQTGWFWKTDINKYFDSIRHDILLRLLRKKIKDGRLLEVTEHIIRNAGNSPSARGDNRGLPIGNLTSQFFANVYLDGFDHFVKTDLHQPYYIRYMDDFVLFHADKTVLKAARGAMAAYLHDELGLTLNPPATFLNSASNGLTFLGRRIFPGVVRLAPANGRRMLRRMELRERDFREGLLDEATFLQSMNSYWAMLEPFYGLRQKILQEYG